MKTFKHYKIFETLPNGWKLDKTTGSPLHGYAVVVSAEKIDGFYRKRHLCKINQTQHGVKS